MLIGYARISTIEQNFDFQIDALKKIGCDKIFKDTASGSLSNRKALTETLEYLRPGDTLVVWRLDRLGRSLKKLIELTNELKDKGVSFKSVVESIDVISQTPIRESAGICRNKDIG